MVAGTWGAQEAEEEPRWHQAVLEAQRGRAFLWAPVALTIGIWTYFGLSAEPTWTVAAACAAMAILVIGIWRHLGAAFLLAMVLAGFSLATFRTALIATPLLHATTAEVAITARVDDVSTAGKRRVLIVSPISIEGLAPGEMPRRLRLSASAKHGNPRPGDIVAAKVRLAPPPGPVMPGGFDFGRQLFFEGIGGTGRITQAMTITEGHRGFRLWLARFLEDTRGAINARINAVLDGDTAAIAEALIDGERGTISKEVNSSFQASGLAHVLSISGLHMSLIAGGVFWLVRAVLALFPALALRWPIKKLAAVSALAAGLFYMLLAGSEVATQRSYIMIAVVFFAVLVDRPALSLRNLALAALIILFLQPEAAAHAGFQMSFLAVLGLAAFFEAWAGWRRRRNDEVYERRSVAGRLMWYVLAAVGASLATTVVAGFMSSIPAAYHFGRIAPYGLVANGLAIPVVSLIVMPMGLVATLLMPIGLEHWPLWLMGQGIDLTITVSDWVASLPGAQTIVPQQAAPAAMISAFGAVMLSLLKGRARLSGVAVMALGVALGSRSIMPDILINRAASNAAFVNDVGELVPASGTRDRFAVERWLIANGEEAKPSAAAKRPGWTCAAGRCSATVRGKLVLYLSDEATAPVCTGAAIVIAAFPLRKACAEVPVRIDRFDVWRNGAHALRITASDVVLTSSRAAQGSRPWVVTPKPRATPFKPN